MFRDIFLSLVLTLISIESFSCGGAAPGDTVVISSSSRYQQQHHHQIPVQQHQQQQHDRIIPQRQQVGSGGSVVGGGSYHHGSGGHHVDHRNSYNLLSEAMSHAVSHEFSSLGSGSAEGACHVDDLECYSGTIQDRLGMEAIRTLHRQLDDDDNGNIDLSESDDFLREELKYDSGYEKRQKAFHFNDDMHISVKELWDAWLRSEVHNWTIEQTTDWLAQSVQLPQYVDLFKKHQVTGAALPRLAVNNMHYVSNVLGIKDPIHKQKIALKAMDVVLFGPPRETGTRWKDYILVTLLLSAIIGCWYAYQQNKNAKKHLKRMAQDMEGLQRAEQSLQEMQKELERARIEQENVATEKMDLERRLKEAPALSSSSSDLELQQLKQEIEMLRTELSRAEVELVDHCWSPPPQLQSWLQYTYELENKNHTKKRASAERQLQTAREACEKLRKKRTSLVGAFVSTHGKSIDDVDRSIVEARNSLGEVTAELQERLHRWKQIEMILGVSIVNNNGISYLENILYNRSNGSIKSSRGRMTNSTDDLDDESVQGFIDNYNSRNSLINAVGGNVAVNNALSGVVAATGAVRDDSSNNSDDGVDSQSVQFYLGGPQTPINLINNNSNLKPHYNHINSVDPHQTQTQASQGATCNASAATTTHNNSTHHHHPPVLHSSSFDSSHNNDESRHSPSVSSECSIPIPPRSKKPIHQNSLSSSQQTTPPPPPRESTTKAPIPPPRRANQSQIMRSQSTEFVQPKEKLPSYYHQPISHYQSTTAICGSIATNPTTIGNTGCSSSFTGINRKYQNFSNSSSASTTPSAGGTPTFNFSGTSKLRGSGGSSRGMVSGGETEALINSAGITPTVITNTIKSPNSTTTTKSKTIITSTHSDTQIEDTISTDSSSIDDEHKKRRKLRFPFGKKSSKNKIA